MRWFLTIGAALAAGCTAAVSEKPAPLPPPAPGQVRAVFHVNTGDLSLQDNLLKNIAAAVGNLKSDAVLEMVVHGDGIDLVHKERSAYPDRITALKAHGVRIVACEATLKQRNIKKEELLAGVDTVPSATVEILRRQQEGYGYFKP